MVLLLIFVILACTNVKLQIVKTTRGQNIASIVVPIVLVGVLGSVNWYVFKAPKHTLVSIPENADPEINDTQRPEITFNAEHSNSNQSLESVDMDID